MGTSNASSGPGNKTPLVPTWIDDIGSAIDLTPRQEIFPDQKKITPKTSTPPALPPIADADRFRDARNNFSRFVSSGGTNRKSLSRSVSKYIAATVGGPGNAAKRMGVSRSVATNLTAFLLNTLHDGQAKALAFLDLRGLSGRSVTDVFLGVMDKICPNGGAIDEGIAREAFIQTIASLPEHADIDLDHLSGESILQILETFVVHSVEARIYNDIGVNTIVLPNNAHEIDDVQQQLCDFIRRGTADAFNDAIDFTQPVSPADIRNIISNIYETAFELLLAFCEEEGNR